MRIAIAGAGNVGRAIARELLGNGHQVLLIDKDPKALKMDSVPSAEWLLADACEIAALDQAKLDGCQVLVAATGDDKVNLVASLLGKTEYGVPRVVARVNHPKNEWMFDSSWGVDVAVSTMRTYGGNLFSEYIKIQESKLAKSMEVKESEVVKALLQLEKLEVIDYDQRKDKPQLTFLTNRYDAGKLPLNHARILSRKNLTIEKAKSMVDYSHQLRICRTQFIQEYFGEKTDFECGICDLCIEKKKQSAPATKEDLLKLKILETLAESGELHERILFEKINKPQSESNLRLLRQLIDLGQVHRTEAAILSLHPHG
jgi:hypothetical protein